MFELECDDGRPMKGDDHDSNASSSMTARVVTTGKVILVKLAKEDETVLTW